MKYCLRVYSHLDEDCIGKFVTDHFTLTYVLEEAIMFPSVPVAAFYLVRKLKDQETWVHDWDITFEIISLDMRPNITVVS